MNKKSQLTIFIILSILLVTLVGAIVWVGVNSNKTEYNTQQSAQQNNNARTQAIHSYLESCLEQVTLSTLETWAKQGGKLYPSQGGIQIEPEQFISFEGTKVPFLILSPEGSIGQIYSGTPPEYPWNGFPYLSTGQQWLYGYYGKSSLSPLYENFSFSVQKSIEQAIREGIQLQCTDLFSIASTPITIGIPSVELTIAQDPLFVLDTSVSQENIIVSATIPLQSEINVVSNIASNLDKNLDGSFGKTESQVKSVRWQESISFSQQARLTKLYHFAKNLIEQDTTRIDFAIQGIHPGGYTVTTVPQGADDLVIIRDDKTIINGRALEFWFSRKNRAPALYGLSIKADMATDIATGITLLTTPLAITTLSTTAPVTTVCQEALISYNAITKSIHITQPAYTTNCGPNMTISLLALDPDENIISYTFKPALPHVVSADEATANKELPLTVFAQDSKNSTDWQTIYFEMRKLK
ncbi:MAG: hypothetical protein Q7K43_01150 [Candidatus Woesearchaeota archaeon]|nr:hypothetical protein [Candidatus Woesearchaeota archaeon]